MIVKTDFIPAGDRTWDGKSLTDRSGIKGTCIRNVGSNKLFVFKQWGGNGFGDNAQYFVVNKDNGEVLRYKGLKSHSVATQIVSYLQKTGDDNRGGN